MTKPRADMRLFLQRDCLVIIHKIIYASHLILQTLMLHNPDIPLHASFSKEPSCLCSFIFEVEEAFLDGAFSPDEAKRLETRLFQRIIAPSANPHSVHDDIIWGQVQLQNPF